MSDQDDERLFEEIGPEDIAAAIANKSRTLYVSTMGRLGFATFSAFVEYSFFHPRLGPESNAEFIYHIVSFGVPHILFSIPRRYENRANGIAKKLKLRVDNKLVPLLIEHGGAKQFPGAKEASTGRRNLYVVESDDRTIYANDRDLNRLIRARETEIVDTLMQRGPVMTPKQAADFLWRRD